MTVAALVLGAGSGERFRASLSRSEDTGGRERATADPSAAPVPKAFVRLAGRTLMAHSLLALAAAPEIAHLVPVLPRTSLAEWPRVAAEVGRLAGLTAPVAGGQERQDSVRAGLDHLPDGVSHVAVHDAARPLVRPADVSRVVRCGVERGAALLAAPVSDTIKRVAQGRVVETPARASFRAAQTPQVFRVDWLREGLEKARAEGYLATDDAELVERLGAAVHVVEGRADNFKITTLADLRAAEGLLAEVGA